jgi:hypothetical protein
MRHLPLHFTLLTIPLLAPWLVGCPDDDCEATATCASPGAGGEGGGGGEGGAGGGGAGGDGAMLERIEVRNQDGTAAAGVPVIVSDPDGEVLESVETDASGDVSVDVPAGGMVTVLDTTEFVDLNNVLYQYRHVTTVLGIEEGGSARFVIVPVPGPALAIQTMDVSIATGTPPAGAVGYRHDLSCYHGIPTLPATFDYPGCPGQLTFDVLAMATDAADLPVAYALVEDVPFIAHGDYELVPTYSGTTFDEFDVTLTSVPPDAFLATSHLYVVRTDGHLQTRFLLGGNDVTAEKTIHHRVPKIGFDRFDVSATVSRSFTDRTIHRWATSSTAPGDLSWDASAIAHATEAPEAELVDGVRARLEYQLSDEGELGALIASVSASHPDAIEGTTRWRVVAAADRSGAFTMPELPEAFAEYRLGAPLFNVTIEHWQLDDVDSHARMLETGGPTFEDEATVAETSAP